jgi:DNA repair exonuclease SbcCD ATPase subunit
MSIGAGRQEAQQGEEKTFAIGQDGEFIPRDFIGSADAVAEEPKTVRAPRSIAQTLLATLLLLLAIGWLAATGLVVARSGEAPTLAAITGWIVAASVPLILLGIVWTIFGRTSRRETERFTRAVAAMRRESTGLERVLDLVAARLEENHARLADEAAKLMALGDEASDRLGRVAHFLSKQSVELDRRAQALDSAAERARIDIGVLVSDLPKAEEQAREVAAAMREAGLTAHEQAGALEGQLAALTARAREVDESVGGAAQRLGAHVARIESSAGSASTRIGEAAGALQATVDDALGRASEAVEATRSGLESQGTAMLASIEQSRAAFAEAGAEATRSLSSRLDLIGNKIEGLAANLASQDEASNALVTGLSRELGNLETRFAALDRSGTDTQQKLSAAMDEVRAAVHALQEEVGDGEAQAGALGARAAEISGALQLLSSQLQVEIPEALGEVERQAGRTREAAETIAPSIEAARALADSVFAAGERLDTLSGQLAEQERAGRALLAGIGGEIEAVETRLAELGASGDSNGARLGAAMADVRAALAAIHDEIRSGADVTGETVARAQALADLLAGVTSQLRDDVPGALSAIEAQSDRAGAVARAILPDVETVQAASAAAAASLAEGESYVRLQQEEIGGLLATIADSVTRAEERLRALAGAAGEADSEARRLVNDTGPELIDALVRVREAANQAASHAREAISAVIPDSVALLAEASRDAISEAVTEPVQHKLAEITILTETAISAARRASERLTRQLITIGETAAAIEDRIEHERAVRDEQDSEALGRRVALLIESLNSTAIDVTKILSNEVTDTAWAAYLKGDRSVFTRRAVRLLDSGEAREIFRHYENEPEFREQVNRYIHDFESILRRVLADRDGSPLGITLLSSDMGKLYVALAQAIERLRT